MQSSFSISTDSSMCTIWRTLSAESNPNSNGCVDHEAAVAERGIHATSFYFVEVRSAECNSKPGPDIQSD